MDVDTIKWIAGISISVVVAIIVFAGNRIAKKNDDRQKRRLENLGRHFKQDMASLLKRIGWCSGLIIENRRVNDSLMFDSTDVVPIPIKRMNFTQSAQFESFGVHFPNIAEKWDELYKQTQRLSQENQNGALNEEEFNNVSSELKELSIVAKDILESISKFNKIGTKEFHYDKKCPICKKF